MDISEMHKMFRQYAQQMGMQNVKAILPEQIDLLINNSISDTINQVITQNIGIISNNLSRSAVVISITKKEDVPKKDKSRSFNM